MNRLSKMTSHVIAQQFSTMQSKTINNIEIHSNGKMAKVVLNKPKALNSLSMEMVLDVKSQIDHLNSHRAFWIEGAGGKAFCAGGDVKALFSPEATADSRIAFFENEYQMDYRLSQSSAVQIANWDGIVMGGGVGISAFSPFIIATENSMYAMPEGKIGLFTDVGAGYVLSRLRSHIGYYLGMTGDRLKGEDVYIAGLANYFIKRENVQKVYEEVSQRVSSGESKGKQDVKAQIKLILDKYHQAPEKKQIANQSAIDSLFSKGSVHSIYDEVKSSSDPFHQKVLKMLEEQCPFSVHVNHRLIELYKNKSIKESFEQDFILTHHFARNQNFSEGVRCLLIDKGDKPKWTHKHLSEVKKEEVEAVFKAEGEHGFKNLGL